MTKSSLIPMQTYSSSVCVVNNT